MTQLILHGPPQSSYVRTARMTALEKGLDARLVPVEFKSPAHLAMHPWGRVPILRDGELELIETAAITHYLDAIGSGPSLVPTEPRPRAECAQWISVINAYVYSDVVLNYVFHYIFPKTADQQPDRALIARDTPAVEHDLRRIEQGFRGEWLTGSTLCLADLFLAPILAYAAMFPEVQAMLETAPNLRRFREAMSRRPSFVETAPPRPA